MKSVALERAVAKCALEQKRSHRVQACSVLALVFLPTLIVGFASRPAHATSCTASANGIGFGESTSTCGVEVGGQSESVGPIGGYLTQAYAASQPGGIAIVANAQAISNSPYLYPDSSAGARASFRIDDVIFRATEGSPASFIDVSLNFAVSGALSAWVAPNSAHPQGNGLTSVNLNVVVSLNDYTSTGWQYFSCNRDGCTGSSVGMFASGTIGQFATGTARVPTGTPVTLWVSAQFDGPRVIDCEGVCGAIGAYGQTISLPTSSPVFSLPDGFSVDAPSLDLFDNTWLGTPPRIDQELTFIPEPNTSLLISLGLTVMAWLRRPTRCCT